MTFREALAREIAAQGISVTEVAQKSRVSKGAIYNILNGTTEEARIRPSTRRALARGCNRMLKMMPDGGVVFAVSGEDEAPREVLLADVDFAFVPLRPFLSHAHVREPFDWLYEQEVRGSLSLGTVDRVFQRREEFLSLEVFNEGDAAVLGVQFTLRVSYKKGPAGKVACRIDPPVLPGVKMEYTLFLLAGPPFALELADARCVDAGGQVRRIDGEPAYSYEGDGG